MMVSSAATAAASRLSSASVVGPDRTTCGLDSKNEYSAMRLMGAGSKSKTSQMS